MAKAVRVDKMQDPHPARLLKEEPLRLAKALAAAAVRADSVAAEALGVEEAAASSAEQAAVRTAVA